MSINTQGYKSIKNLIDIHLSGLGRLDEKYNLDKDLAIEWAVNCLREIGANFYHPEIIPFKAKIKNFQCKLPNYLELIDGVYYCGDQQDLSLDIVWSRLYPIEYSTDFRKRFTGDNKINGLPYNNLNLTSGIRYGYYINYPYLIFNFECGNIEVDYRTAMLDEYGLPMYPDDPYIEQAIKDWITYYWMYEPYLMNDITEGKYRELKDTKDSSIAEARSKQVIPDIIEAREMMTNTIHKYDRFKLRTNRGYPYYQNRGASGFSY